MEQLVESTIQDVLGVAPFTGRAGFVYFPITIKTWLMRQGWNGNAFKAMSPTEHADCYCEFDKATELALKFKQPPMAMDRGRRFAAAAYTSKNSAVVRRVRRLRGTTPVGAPDVEEQEEGGISEARVAEMIAKQMVVVQAAKPVETIIKIVQADKVSVIKGVKHPKLAMLAQAASSRMLSGFHPNIWMFGPTASGKSHSVEQIADGMKQKFYVHGAMSMAHELMGYKDGGGKYHRTPFRDCFEHGGVCLLDECDSWDSSVTLALNGCLANSVAAFPDGMVRRHKDSLFIAAGNTVGAGATAEFVGRNRLDAAFMSRFPVKIEWPRDDFIEKSISGNDAWVARVVAARNRAAAAGIKHAIDPRHSQAGAALIAAGMTLDMAADLTYLAGLPDAQRRTVEGK